MKNILEIMLITYNRKQHLQNTFDQIFAENSPIKNFDITILNNNSVDGSTELIEEYRFKFPNIKHIIHNRNIGGNANIARAFEIVRKKFFWILCDDDEYDWNSWGEVELAIKKDYDAIVVANYMNPSVDTACLIKQLSFVPGGIYKSIDITDTIMVNIEFNIYSMFPHLIHVCNLINNNKAFYICNKSVVNMVSHGAEETYVRCCDLSSMHPYFKSMFWTIGFVNTIQMLTDKNIKKLVVKKSSVNGVSLFKDFVTFYCLNKSIGNNSLKNYCDYVCGIGISKIPLLFLAILLYKFKILIFRGFVFGRYCLSRVKRTLSYKLIK